MAHVVRHIAKTRKNAKKAMDSEKELVEEMMKNVPLMKTADEQKKADKEYLEKLRNEDMKQRFLSGGKSSGGKYKKKKIKLPNSDENKIKLEQRVADKLYQSTQNVKSVNANHVNERQRRVLEEMEKNAPYNKRMEHERAKWIKSGCTEETCPLTSSHYDTHQVPHQPELPAGNPNQPGPMPGMRPTMGGAGGIVPPPQGKGSGAMGIIMPLYTVGIVVFFVYTIMKVLFKKGSDDDKAPKLKDFGLDPEYRKYVFAEEYLDNQNISQKSEYRRQQREESRQRRRMHEVPDTKIEDEQMDHLRQRLEDTELAMERLMNQMGSVTDKLTAAKITEVLSQAQAQAKILKDEAADLSLASEDDLTTSEALTTTMSDETFPSALHRHLQDLQNEENSTSSKGSSPDMEEYEVIDKEGVEQKSCKKQSKESSTTPSTKTSEECPKSTSALKETEEIEESKKETENISPESPTTVTSTEDEHDDKTTTSHSEDTIKTDEALSSTIKTDEALSSTIKTDETLSSNCPSTQDKSDTDKIENDISDTAITDQSKKENLVSEKLSSDDALPTKVVTVEEENSIGKVEE